MIRFLLQKIISRQKELILQEATRIQDFMRLLMKLRNTGEGWTREEKKELKLHLIHLSAYVPVLIIFLLPGGALLVPILADILERRKKGREIKSKIFRRRPTGGRPPANNNISSR